MKHLTTIPILISCILLFSSFNSEKKFGGFLVFENNNEGYQTLIKSCDVVNTVNPYFLALNLQYGQSASGASYAGQTTVTLKIVAPSLGHITIYDVYGNNVTSTATNNVTTSYTLSWNANSESYTVSYW